MLPATPTDPQGTDDSLLLPIVFGVVGGVVGGLAGCPADVVNVRMQADGRLPPHERRAYKNVLDGLGLA